MQARNVLQVVRQSTPWLGARQRTPALPGLTRHLRGHDFKLAKWLGLRNTMTMGTPLVGALGVGL